MNIKYSSTLLGAALGLALLSAPAHGAVTILDSDSVGNNTYLDNDTVATFNFTGFDPTGADKIVASFGTTHSGSFENPINSASFNGQAMTSAVVADSDSVESAIFFLDGSSFTNGELKATFDYSYGASATIWALSGTAAGVGATASSAGASTSLTTTAAESWVLAHTTVGGSTTPVAQSPLTDGVGTAGVYSGRHSTGTGYQTVATAGTVTPTFDIEDMTVAAEFTAIPEPAAALFGGLALLALLRRRR